MRSTAELPFVSNALPSHKAWERLTFMSWARMSPVGPAPMSRTLAPKGILSLSMPWIAHDAGSSSVASSSVRFLIL